MLVKDSSTSKSSMNNKRMTTMKLYPQDSQQRTKWKTGSRLLEIETPRINIMTHTGYPQLCGYTANFFVRP